jgi:6-phosphogluconolactonase
MKITHRCFLFVLACLLATLPAIPQTPTQKFLVFVGTYTDKTDSKGIYAFEFDAATGKLTPKGLAAESSNPSWVVIHPNGKWAYAANESGKQSSVSAFSIDTKSAKLTLLNQLPALGEDPCYLSFDKTGKYLLVANYTSGNVVVFPILPDGKLGEHTAAVKDTGTLGPNKERQEAPHAHWVESSPDNRFVFVADLGLDAILSYRFDATKGTLTPNDPPFVRLAPGAGPRHATFSFIGQFVFVISELNSTATTFSYDPQKGLLYEPQIAATLPKEFSGRNETAEIALHPSGRGLYASNRGHDSIAVFRISDKGTLTSVGIFSTGGKEPRHFAVDPTGWFVLAENQNSNSVVVFRVNVPKGDLTQVSQTEGVPSPVCLVFYPAH